jgi:hypothetical protein
MPRRNNFAGQWDDANTSDHDDEFTRQAWEATFGADAPVTPKKIEVSDNQLQQYGRFQFSRVGLIVPEDMTDEEYTNIGAILLEMQGAIQWWIGDWARLAQRQNKWGTIYDDIVEQTGFENKTIRNWRAVAEAYPDLSLRKDKLTFSHHVLVYTREDRNELLEHAVENNLTTVSKFRSFLKQLDKPKEKDHQSIDLRNITQHRNVVNRLLSHLEKGQRPSRADLKYLRELLSQASQL